MVFITDYRTEDFALHTKWDDFPARVQERAIMCGIDLMTALILGSYGEQFKVGENLALTTGLQGEIPVIGSIKTYNLLGASIVMSHSSNSYDIDDGHRTICGHPGASFVAGVLAAAQEKNVTWREYLTTLTVCYELSIRWALAMQDHYKYFHSTGAYGAFGTAVGIGRLYGLQKEQLNKVLSIADFHAPMTPVMRSVEYPSMNKDGVPFGALVGTMSVLEVLCGSSGRTHLLELPEYSAHLDNLGTIFHIMDLYFKPYTCCRWAHQPILACQSLMRQYSFDYSKVKKVKVFTFLSATRLSRNEPHNTDEAQYNIAWPVASALVFGDVGFNQVRNESLHDNNVLAMMKRIEFIVDPEMDKAFPAKRLAWVEITLKDGSVFRSKVYEAPGEPDDAELNLGWIERKFKRITDSMLCKIDQDEILTTMKTGMDVSVKQIVNHINQSLKHI